MNSSREIIAGDIVVSLLTFQNTIKIYHFQTPSYARHKASDKLFAALTATIDQFMEVLQGSWGVRIKLRPNTGIPLFNTTDGNVIRVLEEFSAWLVQDIPKMLRPQDVDLMNIRDEILSSVSQALYLFTFG
jgi:hypothetical protein